MGEVVELEMLYLLDFDRTLFRSGDFVLALHNALLGLVDDDLPSSEQVTRDVQAESLPFATYYHHKNVQLKTLYAAAKTLDDTYVYDDVGVIDELPGRTILYTKGERDTQELKLHHSGLSQLSEGSTNFDETSKPGVWIVQTNKGDLLKRAIDQNASDANTIVLRWKGVEYRTKELIFVDDKYEEIKLWWNWPEAAYRSSWRTSFEEIVSTVLQPTGTRVQL